MPAFTVIEPAGRQHPESTGQEWKSQLRDAVSDVGTLLDQLGLDANELDVDLDNRFRLRVPQAYIDKMTHGDADDPLLRQVLPLLAEHSEDGLIDPVADLGALQAPGLLQKYHGRALLITTGACAVHCRYCFRRHYPYSEAGCRNDLDEVMATLATRPDIDEIILSGGDPLVLDDERLAQLLYRITELEQIRYLRIHTRLPVVLPDRITTALIDLLSHCGLRTSMVIHANHANEIGCREQQVLGELASAGITLLNQSVLLKGINDDSETLAELSKRLFDAHVVPYYLHLLDPVQGAMHFDTSEQRACEIIEQMRSRLPGYLVPTLVREVPESDSKTAISSF